jgi:Na+-translocating ferredoxin:NAD+ oxidoreductase RnfD subunit
MRDQAGRTIIYPSLRDPRWVQLLFLLSFVGYALSSPGFGRTRGQWVAGLVTCLGLDFTLARLTRGILLAPVSGLISSMGLLLLCDSPWTWPYVAVGAIAVLSKQFIRFQGKHIFNPLNFGIVVGLLAFSRDMTVVPGRWGGSVAGFSLIAALGAFVAYRARRLDLCVTYVLTFAAGVVVRTALRGGHFLSPGGLVTVGGPMVTASFQLFTFFMISDPMTTPETRRARILFAFILGVADSTLRFLRVEHSPFFALFVLCGFLPMFRQIAPATRPENIWRPALWRLGGRAARGPDKSQASTGLSGG